MSSDMLIVCGHLQRLPIWAHPVEHPCPGNDPVAYNMPITTINIQTAITVIVNPVICCIFYFE